MKATNKKTQWLLLALLSGVIAAAGLTLTRHHSSPTVAKANPVVAPKHAVIRQPHAPVLAAVTGKHTLWAPAGLRASYVSQTVADSNKPQPPAAGHSGTLANGFTAKAWSTLRAGSVEGSSNATPVPGNRTPTPVTSHLPQDLGGTLAFNGYSPLDCELPAGCGASGGGTTSNVSRPTATSTSGSGQAFVHDSQGSSPNNDGSTPPTNDGNPPPGNNPPPSNNGQQGSNPQNPPNPPGSDPAAAPELDPGTLAAAITLLFGSLLVLRKRRRVRVTR